MTPEQKAAFIIAQAAMVMARVAGMQAENQHREACGQSVAYGMDAFEEASLPSVLGHNAVITFFED